MNFTCGLLRYTVQALLKIIANMHCLQAWCTGNASESNAIYIFQILFELLPYDIQSSSVDDW